LSSLKLRLIGLRSAGQLEPKLLADFSPSRRSHRWYHEAARTL